jgi:hypothetical protein
MADGDIIKKYRGRPAITEPYDVSFFAKKHGITLEVATCILSCQGRTREQHDHTARKFKAGRWSLPSLNNSSR